MPQLRGRALAEMKKPPTGGRKRDNAYEPIDRCIDLLGDHGHPRGAGDAYQAHPQQAGGAVL